MMLVMPSLLQDNYLLLVLHMEKLILPQLMVLLLVVTHGFIMMLKPMMIQRIQEIS
jgi:hypothetical protein